MLELPHAVVGATIAVLIPNPLISIPLSLASHFAVDLLPHWNPNPKTEIKKYGHLTSTTQIILWSDSFLALTTGLVIAGKFLPNYLQSANVLLCCFASVLPDLLVIPLVLYQKSWPWLKKLGDFEASLQSRLPAPAGVYTQILLLLACFYLIYRFI
jgi:hypothetical protein